MYKLIAAGVLSTLALASVAQTAAPTAPVVPAAPAAAPATPPAVAPAAAVSSAAVQLPELPMRYSRRYCSTGAPPVDAGATQVTLTAPDPVRAAETVRTIDGADTGGLGVTEFDAALSAPVPTALLAVTLKV